MRTPSPVAVGVGISTIALYTITAVGASSPASAAAASPSGVKATGSASILHLSALRLPGGTTLAEAGVGTSAGSVDGASSPRTSARAANLDAALADRAVGDILAVAQQTAPPDHPSPASERSVDGSVPGVLSLGVSTARAGARWTGDSTCPAPATPLSSSSVSTADLATSSIPQAGSLLALDGTASSSERTVLADSGRSGIRKVVSTAQGSAADLGLLDGRITVGVVDAPTLTATATGQPGGAAVDWHAPVVTVRVDGQAQTLPADGSPLDLSVPGNPLLHARLALGQPQGTVESADGTHAAATASVLSIELSVGTAPAAVTVLDADLFPLRADATAPRGGVSCGAGSVDSDGDGLTDAEETSGSANGAYGNAPTNPHLADTDGDGLSDGVEVTGSANDAFGNKATNPTDPDTDGDGLNDKQETTGSANTRFGSKPTDPRNPDTDGDWLVDGRETNRSHTDPNDPDTDTGSVQDGAEVARGSDPLNPADDVVGSGSGQDPNDLDGDGLSNADEVKIGSSAVDADTDGDGLTDGQEVKIYKTSPTRADTDGDGLTDGQEVKTYKTKPRVKDTDKDGLTDGQEVKRFHTKPLRKDTDKDGLTDGAEVKHHRTDPKRKDTDKDGLTDGREVKRFHTKPLRKDTDKDGLTDGREVHHPSKRYPGCATNPKRKDSDKDGLTDGAEVKRHHTNPCDWDTDNGGVSDGREVRAGSNPLDGTNGPSDVRRKRWTS